MQCSLRIRVVACRHRNLLCLRSNLPGPRQWRPQLQHLTSRRHNFSISSIPALILPPLVFTGLLVSLWTYKCLMMIIFQNKIIYMPSMPPFSRSEKISTYAKECLGIGWTEHALKSLDGTRIKIVEGSVGPVDATTNVVVVYFQGNASSIPPRLPYLSRILKTLESSHDSDAITNGTRYTFVLLSYRGYWTSKGRASQKGFEMDAQATLNWVNTKYAHLSNTRIVLWGQSIGAGVAATALATRSTMITNKPDAISGLLLETPFTCLRSMLISLYPQKFLPYRYLGPFLASTWDSTRALTQIRQAIEERPGTEDKILKVLLLEAGDDELVPKGEAEALCNILRGCKGVSVDVRVLRGALHTNVMMKPDGRKEIIKFLQGCA